MKKIYFYPGRFQPMGPHHAEVFLKIMSDYDTESIGPFIITSDKVEQPKSPFNFKEKKQIMVAHGVPEDRIIQVSNPYYAKEVLFNYDSLEVEAIYLVGEKDMAEDPRFKKTKGTTKDGYKWSIEVAPHVEKDLEGEEMSGTSLRATLANADEETLYSIMGFKDKKIFDLIKNKLNPEGIEELFTQKWWNNKLFQGEEPYGDTTAYKDHWKSNDPGPKKPVEPAYKYKRKNFPFRSMYESRGGEAEMHIYDFDETIARAETPIPYEIKSPNGEVIESGETTSIEFEKTKEKLENEYDEGVVIDYNFDAFKKLIGDATLNNPVFQKLLDSLKNPNAKVTILTARSVGLPVTQFLKEQGIWAYVVPLGLEIDGAVTGQDKANWIEKRIKDTTKKVIFIDDADENREAVNVLSQKYSNIEFDIQDPPKIKDEENVGEMMMGTMNKAEKRRHKRKLQKMRKSFKKYNKKNRYFKVPKSWKGSLTRKSKKRRKKRVKENLATINDQFIPLEIMNTPEEHMRGMMGRDSLEGGMLFPYNNTQKRNFHMEDCLISLDIVFTNKGTIDTIHSNCPPCKETPCPKYSGLADNVLELPGGYCKENNINIGDKFNLNLTENKMEENVFTKKWWSKIIIEQLLTEGGAAGHMAHPFNLPDVNSGGDLKDIFNKAAESLQNDPGSVKIDGVNSSIRLIDLDGEKQFVMDRGSKKELDVKGITKDDLLNRFGDGHGMVKIGGEVLDMFNKALPSIKGDLEKLGAYDDPNILFNMEYVSGKTNVQDYGSNFIAIHGLNKIETKEVQGKRKMLTKRTSSEISYDKSALQSLLDNLTPTAKEQGFEVYGSVPTEMTKKPNFSSALSTSYTIVSNEGEKTQNLDQWLNELNDIPEEDFIFMNVDNSKKKVGAVSKQVYTTLLSGGNIDELFENEEDKKKAIEGFTTYLATEKLGDEILKVLDSPMGSVDNHEGVVIRDENIANMPFKITGKFILGGMTSDF